jgi:hypothetical protein
MKFKVNRGVVIAVLVGDNTNKGRELSHLKHKLFNDTPPTHQISPHFELTTLLCKFALLIEKDGGIRPCDVLATCAYKVLRSTYPPQKWIGKISESQYLRPTFRHKLF